MGLTRCAMVVVDTGFMDTLVDEEAAEAGRDGGLTGFFRGVAELERADEGRTGGGMGTRFKGEIATSCVCGISEPMVRIDVDFCGEPRSLEGGAGGAGLTTW